MVEIGKKVWVYRLCAQKPAVNLWRCAKIECLAPSALTGEAVRYSESGSIIEWVSNFQRGTEILSAPVSLSRLILIENGDWVQGKYM
jgi:hypothetical protein